MMQKCPKCDGQGSVSKPPWIPGDVYEWSSTSAVYVCDVCNGAKIISTLTPELKGKEDGWIKVKSDLIWEMIQGWQDSRDINEDLNAPQFSYNDIEIDLYEWLNKIETKGE